MQRGTTVDYYEADGLGSITSLTAANGSVAQTYVYDSFGNTTNSTGSLTNFLRYTAREFDTESNLYYYRARYYDPTTGRFASEDPIRFRGGINVYRYVKNSVTNSTDPIGFWTISLGGTINVNLGFASFQYSGGFVIDGCGGFGVYNSYPLGGGAFGYGGLGNFPNPTNGYPFNNISPVGGGTDASIGLSLQGSNAKCICDLSGPFLNGSVGLGEGLAASADGFVGTSDHGTVVGGGLTVGGGIGGGGSITGTTTKITPLTGNCSGCH